MMTNKPRGRIYTGVTNDIVRRVHEHRERKTQSFTQKYWLRKLVWYEQHEEIYEALKREKRLKKWLREWKCALIETHNPDWEDLWESILK
jgi:putative endonuclease